MLRSRREREPAYMLWIPGTGSLCTCSIHPGASNLPTASCLHSERPTVPHHRHHKVVALRNMVCGRANLLTRYSKEPFLQDKSQFSSLLTTRALLNDGSLLPTGSLLNTASLLTNASFISVINQLDAKNFYFTISLFHASTCFKHMCSSSGGQNCIRQPLVSSHL